VFVTNNASRPPAEVAQSLSGMGVRAEPEDVLTSPQAAAVMLTDRHPPGTKVLVIGAPWLSESVSQAGLVPVRLAADEPAAVVQGHSPETGWRELAEASIALRAGADWVACNVDSTLPTDRGLLPGNGSMVAALTTATGLAPRVAGKPARPLLDAAVRLVKSQRPLVVGDRLDTDIACAVAAEAPSLLVFTGVSRPADLLAAVPAERPTYLAFDLRGLVEEDHAVRIPATSSAGTSLEWTVTAEPDTLLLAATAGDDGAVTDASALRALAMLTVRAWATGLVTVRAKGSAAAAALARCGLGQTPAQTPTG
jgi:HAD superfamily hydrolase (TIGR01450 family)